MNLGNLRGILHQGVREYLKTLAEDPDPEEEYRLVGELDAAISLDEAAQWLGIAIEAVVENYGEYVDYNSITTQSDRGEMLYTLLDFLRLRANYDRLAWNLRPVVLAHEVLVRGGREGAAEIWRRAVAERTASIAEDHLRRFQRLCKKYGMHLPSIAEHLSERFIRPLEIDRLCALLRPAADELRQDRARAAVKQLERADRPFHPRAGRRRFRVAQLARSAGAGDGTDPVASAAEDEADLDPLVRLPQVRLSRAQFQRQMRQMFDDGAGWALGDEQ